MKLPVAFAIGILFSFFQAKAGETFESLKAEKTELQNSKVSRHRYEQSIRRKSLIRAGFNYFARNNDLSEFAVDPDSGRYSEEVRVDAKDLRWRVKIKTFEATASREDQLCKVTLILEDSYSSPNKPHPYRGSDSTYIKISGSCLSRENLLDEEAVLKRYSRRKLSSENLF